MKIERVIISGGGTGGHIFPALAIASEIRKRNPDAEILFVGALGRMEMEKVPAAGYKIVGLPVMGFPRKPGFKMVTFFVRLIKSSSMAKNIVRDFKPKVTIGVGGYASGPLLRAATAKGIPALIQEQNSYAGITNKLLSKKVNAICVAYDKMERYFPAEKIKLTGNPVRESLLHSNVNKKEALEFFGLKENDKVILVVGGSLGARSINNAILKSTKEIAKLNVRIIWQTGAIYYERIQNEIKDKKPENLQIYQFISRMDLAYVVAGVVISRAGAGTISELCLVGKPSILVPSPNVAEDHQTKNAMALVEKDAALMIKDDEIEEKLVSEAVHLIKDEKRCRGLSEKIKTLAKPNATKDIVDEVEKNSAQMKNLENIKNVYFLGIGGIGMSALARYFKFAGCKVAGYDRTPTALTSAMQKEGIDIHFDDDIRNIPKNWNPAETLAVFTPALPDDHQELSWFREKPIGLLKRAKVLGLISNEKSGIAVAGTHGKTTISTMTATILNETTIGCSAFLGGVSKNFGSNLLLPKADSPWIVAEADEFDRSFLHLQPQLALISAIDADHLDIYGDREKIVEAFEKFISQIKPSGKLVIKNGVKINKEKTSAEIFSYSLKDESDFYAKNLKLDTTDGCYRFDLKTPGGIIANCKMHYPGLVNVENAIGAAALCFLARVSADEIKTGLQKYAGVQRRFDVRYKSESQIFIDDYAHHPKELEAVISSVQALYPNRNVTGIFQPHLYTRTRDFAGEFAESLDLLDEAILIPLYPAREEPIKGISSETIFEKMKLQNRHLLSREEALELLQKEKTDVLLTMGAGDIDRMAENIIDVLKSKN